MGGQSHNSSARIQLKSSLTSSTAKRLQDRSIVSSIKPKFDDKVFLIYVVCTISKCEICFDLQNWSSGTTISSSQFRQSKKIYKKNCRQILGL